MAENGHGPPNITMEIPPKEIIYGSFAWRVDRMRLPDGDQVLLRVFTPTEVITLRFSGEAADSVADGLRGDGIQIAREMPG